MCLAPLQRTLELINSLHRLQFRSTLIIQAHVAFLWVCLCLFYFLYSRLGDSECVRDLCERCVPDLMCTSISRWPVIIPFHRVSLFLPCMQLPRSVCHRLSSKKVLHLSYRPTLGKQSHLLLTSVSSHMHGIIHWCRLRAYICPAGCTVYDLIRT